LRIIRATFPLPDKGIKIWALRNWKKTHGIGESVTSWSST
jgi:hypothetical protein